MDRDTLLHRMHVYQDRLRTEVDPERRDFYEREIIDMMDDIESDEAKDQLLAELEMLQPWEVETDSWETIVEIVKEKRVVFLDTSFSWRHFKKMWVIQYYDK